MIKIYKKEILQIEENNIEFVFLTFENALSIYIYEEKPLIGTISLSTPATDVLPSSTVFMVGTKFDVFIKMAGERIASSLNKIVMLSIYLKNENYLPSIWNKLEEIIKKGKEES